MIAVVPNCFVRSASMANWQFHRKSRMQHQDSVRKRIPKGIVFCKVNFTTNSPTNVEPLENRGYRPTANWVEKQLRMCLAAIAIVERHLNYAIGSISYEAMPAYFLESIFLGHAKPIPTPERSSVGTTPPKIWNIGRYNDSQSLFPAGQY